MVKWISHRSSEPLFWVRILVGAQAGKRQCGIGLVVEYVLAKDETGVRFSYSAPQEYFYIPNSPMAYKEYKSHQNTKFFCWFSLISEYTYISQIVDNYVYMCIKDIFQHDLYSNKIVLKNKPYTVFIIS